MEAFISAEEAGFEPALPVKVNTLSKRAPSATRPPFHPIGGRPMVAPRVPTLLATPRVNLGTLTKLKLILIRDTLNASQLEGESL